MASLSKRPALHPYAKQASRAEGSNGVGICTFQAMEQGERPICKLPVVEWKERGHGLCHQTAHSLSERVSHHSGKGGAGWRTEALSEALPLSLFPGVVPDFE